MLARIMAVAFLALVGVSSAGAAEILDDLWTLAALDPQVILSAAVGPGREGGERVPAQNQLTHTCASRIRLVTRKTLLRP